MASAQLPIVPSLIYRSTGLAHLGVLLCHLYNVQPQLAPHIKTIILSTAWDDANGSRVLELLYCKDWSADMAVDVDEKSGFDSDGPDAGLDGTGTGVSKPAREHPFTTIREDLSFLTFEDDIETVRATPDLYLGALASLLGVCVNLETLYLPTTWVGRFKTDGFRLLRFVGTTEHLDAVRSRRDSGVDLGD